MGCMKIDIFGMNTAKKSADMVDGRVEEEESDERGQQHDSNPCDPNVLDVLGVQPVDVFPLLRNH